MFLIKAQNLNSSSTLRQSLLSDRIGLSRLLQLLMDTPGLLKPVLKYKYVDIPITPIVANILDKQHATFAKQIDDQVTSALDMKPYALQVWNILNTPIQVSEEYESWLKIQPSSIQMTPLKTNKTGISGIINILVNSQTTIGVKPQIPPPATQSAQPYP
jgi:hypothetical protein